MSARRGCAQSIELHLLSQCDLLVGKHTSNYFRAAFELHAAECDCVPPFVSLDAPWCFDYGRRIGRSRALPPPHDKFYC